MRNEIIVAIISLLSLCPIVMGADNIAVTTDVSKTLSVTFYYDAVSFGTVSQGSNDNHPDPDYGTNTVYNCSVSTNADWKVSVNGTAFTDGVHTFGIGNLTVDTNAVAGSVTPATAVTTSKAQVDTYSTHGTNIWNHQGFLLDIPAYQDYGSYSTTLTWTVENQ